MDKDGKGFRYLQEKFQNLPEAKLQAGIFTGLQIRELLKDVILKNLSKEIASMEWPKSCYPAVPWKQQSTQLQTACYRHASWALVF